MPEASRVVRFRPVDELSREPHGYPPGCEPVVDESDHRRLLWLMAEYFRTLGYTDIKARLPGFVPPPILSGTLEDHRPDFTCRQLDGGKTPIIL
jgi:hypothetical protein